MRFLKLLSAAGLLAQAQTFDQASIRVAQPSGVIHIASHPSVLINASLLRLLSTAFDVADFRIAGPAWLRTERFEVSATAAYGATAEQRNAMLRNLLTERFRITMHHEQRQTEAYLLGVATGGPKLIPAGSAPVPLVGRGINCPNCSIDRFVTLLASRLQKPVVDATGLQGNYDIGLSYQSENSSAPRAISAAMPNTPVNRGSIDAADIAFENRDIALWPPDPSGAAPKGPTLLAAIQKQLGLALEKKRVPLDVIVIDHIDKMPVAK